MLTYLFIFSKLDYSYAILFMSLDKVKQISQIIYKKDFVIGCAARTSRKFKFLVKLTFKERQTESKMDKIDRQKYR